MISINDLLLELESDEHKVLTTLNSFVRDHGPQFILNFYEDIQPKFAKIRLPRFRGIILRFENVGLIKTHSVHHENATFTILISPEYLEYLRKYPA